MPVIKTPEDWWKVVDEMWEELLSLCCRWGPSSDQIKNLPMDEIEGVMKYGGWTGYLIHLRNVRDWEKLHSVFERVWAEAPDVPGLSEDYRAWPDLCDLCSEFWVFEEEFRKKYPDLEVAEAVTE